MKKMECKTDSISVCLATFALVVFVACAVVAANTPIPMADSLTNTLTTAWGLKVTPENAWREYPRPQMVRGSWQCLNGEWEFAVTLVTADAPRTFPERILVPFGPVPLDDGGAWRERNRTRYLELMKPVVEMARKGLGGCVFTEAQDQYWEFMGFVTFDRAVVKFDFDFLRSVHAEIYEAARAGAAGND